MASLFNSGADRAARRATILANHLIPPELAAASILSASNCLHYNPPELTNPASFNPTHLRGILDGHHVAARDWLFKLMEESPLFCPKKRCEGKVFVAPDYNATKEQQREMNMRRIEFLLNNGVFEGWLTDSSAEATMRKFALMECLGVYDHSLVIKIGTNSYSLLVDVESLFERISLSARVEPDKGRESTNRTDSDGQDLPMTPRKTNRTAAMVASSGGVLALAILCNKVLFPIRVPITIALTPPIARYLAKRKLLSNSIYARV